MCQGSSVCIYIYNEINIKCGYRGGSHPGIQPGLPLCMGDMSFKHCQVGGQNLVKG